MIFNAGGADYISYPFSSSEILMKISTQIQLKTLKEKLKEKNNQLQKLIPYYKKLKLALEKTQLELANLTKKEKSGIVLEQKTFQTVLEKEWLRGARQRSSFGDVAETNISLIMAQINDFDAYQENYEPEVIQNCLQIVVDSLRSLIRRPGDLVAHIEKGKFAIILPNTDRDGARTVAEKIHSNIESVNIRHTYSDLSDYISFSIGIANGIPTHGLPPDILIEVAENALKQALQARKNNQIEIDYI